MKQNRIQDINYNKFKKKQNIYKLHGRIIEYVHFATNFSNYRLIVPTDKYVNLHVACMHYNAIIIIDKVYVDGTWNLLIRRSMDKCLAGENICMNTLWEFAYDYLALQYLK